MTLRRRRFTSLASAAAAAAVLPLSWPGGVVAAAPSPAPKAPGAGDAPPEPMGHTIDGELITAPRPGQAMVLTFWATWCTYCRQELPVLDGIQRVAGPDRLQVVAVNTEERDVFRKVHRVLKDKLALRLAYDPGQLAQTAWGVHSLPHMVIIGRDGRIDAIFKGYSDDGLDAIVAAINRAIGATPAAGA